jgi:ZIP family zinc transporter
MNANSVTSSIPTWVWAVLPVVLLVVALGLFVHYDPMQMLTGDQPPVKELSVQRTQLTDKGIVVHVVNSGPEPVTVAQVQVDEAYWSFEMEPSRTLDRLETATVRIPYHWVHGEPHEVRLVTGVGITFSHTIEVSTETPTPTPTRWGLFALLGAFVGIVPVGLGLMWFPVLQKLSERAMNFILALTVGLLVFLLVDTVLEGIEIAEQVADVFQALPLVVFGVLLSFLVLVAAGTREGVADRTTPAGRRWVATAIALGIGLHNLGEGLAVGAAIASGEAALGSFLVIGFVLHNLTEGVGIGAPMASDAPGVGRLVGLVLLAGAPAIFGTWLGGFSYSPLLAVLFFAIGAGAILQVIVEVGRLLVERAEGLEAVATSWVNLSGVTAGLAVMYATALLV